MPTFIVIADFDPAVLPEMTSVIAEEGAQVEILKAQGRLGSVFISPARGRVLLEVFAEDEAGAEASVQTLPMAKWWELDVYPTMGPPGPPVTD